MNIKFEIKSGILKKKYINFKNLYTTKPTKDIIKKIIISYIKNFNAIYCLELFAGTAKTCFELFSIGAKKIITIEKNNKIVEVIKKNKLYLIQEGDFNIYLNDANIWLKKMNFLNISFIIYDPPYKETNNIYFKIINSIKILKKFITIIIEANNTKIIEIIPFNFFIIKKTKIGQTIIFIIKKI